MRVAKELPKLKDPHVIDKSIDAIRDLARYAKNMDGPQHEKPGAQKAQEVIDVIRDYIKSSMEKAKSSERDIDF